MPVAGERPYPLALRNQTRGSVLFIGLIVTVWVADLLLQVAFFAFVVVAHTGRVAHGVGIDVHFTTRSRWIHESLRHWSRSRRETQS